MSAHESMEQADQAKEASSENRRIALLIAVILGFFAYTRYKVSHFGRDLPGKLGVNIQQDANGFTFSKSQGGHTLFTLHASKLVQYKGGGRATLHDVSINGGVIQGSVTTSPGGQIVGDLIDIT